MIDEPETFEMVVALSRGLPVRFKSARVVVVAGEERALVDTLVRMGIADVCCVSEMAAAQTLCDAGGVDACLVVLPRALPDDKPDWDARTDAPGRGRVPSLLFAEAATPYVRRAAADAGYHAVIPIAVSSRMLYRCIGALLQAGRRQGGAGATGRMSRAPAASAAPRVRRRNLAGPASSSFSRTSNKFSRVRARATKSCRRHRVVAGFRHCQRRD